MLRVMVTVLALMLAGAASAEGLRFVVVAHGATPAPFWTVVKNGVDGAAQELGVTADFVAVDNADMTAMSQRIDEAVDAGADGIAVTIPDSAGLEEAIGRAVGAGVPVVSFHAGEDAYSQLGISVHVGQSAYEAGFGAGERMKSLGVGRAVCLDGATDDAANLARCDGFRDGMGGASERLALPRGMFAIEGRVANYLAEHGDVDGALILGSAASAPVIAALTGSGRLEEMTLASFDLSREGLDNVRSRDVAFAVDLQPYLQGYLPVMILAKKAQLGVAPLGVVRTGPSFVTVDNVEQVLELSEKHLR